MSASSSVELQYTSQERLPCQISCNIHPWMRGWLLLRDTPYMAKSDSDGKFAIKNLPTGEHTFQLWHEKIGYLRNIKLGSLATNDRGRLTVTIKAGANRLNEVRLTSELFEAE